MLAQSFLLAVFAAALAVGVAAHDASECIQGWNGIDDVFDSGAALKGYTSGTKITAEGFNIQFRGFYKVITVYDKALYTSGSVGSSNFEQYIMWMCGTRAPTSTELASAKTDGLASIKAAIPTYANDLTQKVFRIPIESIALAETVSAGFLMDALAAQDHVKYFSAYSVHPCLSMALIKHKSNASACGYTNSSPVFDAYTSNTGLLTAQKGDSGAVLDSSLNNSDDKYIAFFTASDASPLKRAEWVKVIGSLLNLDQAAYSYFSSESKKYESIKAEAQVTRSQNRIKIAFINHNAPYVSPGWTSPGYYEINLVDFKRAYVEDAGAIFPEPATSSFWSGTGGTASATGSGIQWTYNTDAERAVAADKMIGTLLTWGADVVIDETYSKTPATFDLTEFYKTFCLQGNATCEGANAAANRAAARFLRSPGAVVRNDRIVSAFDPAALGWFESNIARPTQFLADLLRFSGSNSSLARQSFLRDLTKGEGVSTLQTNQCVFPLTQCCKTGDADCSKPTVQNTDKNTAGAQCLAWGTAAAAALLLTAA